MVGEMNELALFAGAGGGILGGKLLGWRTVCAVEWEAYPASVLCARQNDGLLPPFPIWDDVQTFDGKPWAGIVDVVSGGFPCQDISISGSGTGLDGERSGMWRQMARIISEVRPRFAFVENSPMLVTRGLERVIADLTAMGYDSRWGVISAADVGAKHKRERIWIVAKLPPPAKVAYTNSLRWTGRNNATLETDKTIRSSSPISFETSIEGLDRNTWKTEPDICRVVDGMAAKLDNSNAIKDRLKAIGNGQVPLCAATAWRILTER
jgi:DNA (cytosine-5)-methyltransferase 1